MKVTALLTALCSQSARTSSVTIALLVLALNPMAAQQAPARAATTPGNPADQAVVLSLFEVSTERDTGFVAASALAGGRLAGELRDTPVAYSAITREFIEALNLTDLQSAADWTTGTSYEHDIETPHRGWTRASYNSPLGQTPSTRREDSERRSTRERVRPHSYTGCAVAEDATVPRSHRAA